MGSSFATKVYIVMQTNNVARRGAANRRIHSVWLRRSDADAIYDQYPGTYVVPMLAGKDAAAWMLDEETGEHSKGN